MRLITSDRLPEEYHEHSAWFDTHIPLFDCPDQTMQAIYYFRWDVYRQHIKQTPAGSVITACLSEVPWAGLYNTLVSAAGHHLYEGRWLRQAAYLDDYSRFWLIHSCRNRNGSTSAWNTCRIMDMTSRFFMTGIAASISVGLDSAFLWMGTKLLRA